MINEESLSVIRESLLNANFIKPIYETYGFAQLPNTIRALLTGETGPGRLPPKTLAHLPTRYDRVILLLIDAFGWRFLQRTYDSYPFLKRIVGEGVVSKLTSMFPSTTAAHLTTIHSGLPVGASGVYEWFFYEPTLDTIISPLIFSYAGDKDPGTLKTAGIHPRTLFPRRTLYQDLNRYGIKSYAFQHRSYAHSPASEALVDGARIVPYSSLAEALTNLTALALQETGRAYFYLYYDAFDTTCHLYGPESPHINAEIDVLLFALERLFHGALAGKLKNTLLLITADHGQVEVSPETTTYLNQAVPALEGWLKRNLKGQLLVPAGSARDMFLHIKPECIDDAFASLERHLDGRAEVYRVPDLIAQGFFGPDISQAFLDRVGDLVVLPYRGQAVWWYEKGRFEQTFQGHHGGLTCEESETILMALPYV